MRDNTSGLRSDSWRKRTLKTHNKRKEKAKNKTETKSKSDSSVDVDSSDAAVFPNRDSHVIAPQVQVLDGKIVVQDQSLVLNVPATDPGWFGYCAFCVCFCVFVYC